MVYFSPNNPVSQRATLSSMLKMKVVNNLDRYLGLPILIGKKKSAAFKSIVDCVASRINSWSKRLLSKVGKEIFIKLILQAIPTYAFSIFFVPNGVLEELQSMIFRVWELRWFNVALLGRQVWRLVSCRDTLCFRVLSVKYFSDGDVFHPKKVDKPSFTWQSIAKAASILHDGFDWNVGWGNKINIWHDNWGFEGLLGASIGLNRSEVPKSKVCDLLTYEKYGWNERRIFEIYGVDLGEQICKIPILHNGPDDYRIWFHNPFASVTTKSTYSWLTLKHLEVANSSKNQDFLPAPGNSRNNRVFREVEEEAKVTWDRAVALSQDFRIFNFLEKPILPKPAIKRV
ncbi:uncharacterized protein [Gossypium hirsutum]|uniref:Reverse transcriptase n=1 Tax=Gossypium hirsutum TaxID=3635 RepID=A0A1U8KIB6_GOSHI|nr:uncharacterized protein LOC107917347 [Gossypium hirsutum]